MYVCDRGGSVPTGQALERNPRYLDNWHSNAPSAAGGVDIPNSPKSPLPPMKGCGDDLAGPGTALALVFCIHCSPRTSGATNYQLPLWYTPRIHRVHPEVRSLPGGPLDCSQKQTASVGPLTAPCPGETRFVSTRARKAVPTLQFLVRAGPGRDQGWRELASFALWGALSAVRSFVQRPRRPALWEDTVAGMGPVLVPERDLRAGRSRQLGRRNAGLLSPPTGPPLPGPGLGCAVSGYDTLTREVTNPAAHCRLAPLLQARPLQEGKGRHG